MKAITSLALLISLFLLSCSGEKKDSAADVITVDVLKAFNTQKPAKLSDFIEDIEFIPLESTPDSYFRIAYGYSIGKKYIVIADGERSHLVLFDRTGKFIRTIGTHGTGPGEMIEPYKTTLDPKEEFVFVTDVGTLQLSKYSIEGEFVNSVSTKEIVPTRYTNGIRFINAKEFVLVNWRPYSSTEGFASLPVFDTELNHTRDILPRANDENLVINVKPHALFSVNPERMTFWEPFSDTLYTIKPSGETVPTHVIGFSSGGPDHQFVTTNFYPNLSTENFINTILDDGQNLHITGKKKNDWFLAIYNHQSQEIIRVAPTPSCDPSGVLSFGGLDNDLWGAGTVSLTAYEKNLDRYITWGRLDLSSQYLDFDCIRRKTVKFPELRDRFIKFANDPEGSVQDIIILMKMKKIRPRL